MAGDEILMGDGAFLMIHNAWAVAIGNRHDMTATAAVLAPFDAAMAKVYSQRAGISEADAAAMMDKETWIGSDQAVADGFASGLIDSAQINKNSSASGNKKAMALIEASMAKAGYSRSQRRDAFKALFTGTPGAAGNPAMPSAGEDVAASLQNLINAIQG
jgi:hypothetical protein